MRAAARRIERRRRARHARENATRCDKGLARVHRFVVVDEEDLTDHTIGGLGVRRLARQRQGGGWM